MNVMISGARRGLGACLVKKFLSCGDTVFAGVRPGEGPGELRDVWNNPELVILPMDVTRPEDLERARCTVGKKVDCLNVLINVAGILLNKEGFITQDSYRDLETTFKVNTIAPMYINNIFLDLLCRSANPTIINISSEVKSIDDVGSWFPAYCISKTAVAQYAIALKATLDQQKIPARVFAVHPGRMRTAMGGKNSEIDPEESAEGIYRIAVGDILPDNREVYIDYKGNPMLPKR